MIFNTYWRFLGFPLSKLKGTLVDSFAFPLTEVFLWIGLAATFFALLFLLKKKWNFFLFSFLLGPCLLFFQTAGQGAFPFFLVPSGWRADLHQQLSPAPFPESEMKAGVKAVTAALNSMYTVDPFKNLSETKVLKECNLALDGVLRLLSLPKGRTVERVKAMQGISRLLGLSYGGPAYHDPLTAELALVRDADLPTPRHWRVQAICHETAHAKGFSREIDAEILTQLALWNADHPALQAAGLIQFLEKSGYNIKWPVSLTAEKKNAKLARKKVQEKQYLVNLLKKVNKKFSIQNSGEKYGDRKSGEPWNPNHPYFSTVASIMNPAYFNSLSPLPSVHE